MRRAVAIAIAFVLGGCGLDRAGAGAGADATTDAIIEDVSVADVEDASIPDADDGATGDGIGDVSDAAPSPGPCPAGVICNGVCTAAATCGACTGAPLFCAPTRRCLAECGGCAGTDDAGAPRPIECFSCDASRANPTGTCEPKDPTVYCLNDLYGATFHCSCGPDGSCMSPQQICTDVGFGTPVCRTCGEKGSDGFACKNGKTCNAAASSCD